MPKIKPRPQTSPQIQYSPVFHQSIGLNTLQTNPTLYAPIEACGNVVIAPRPQQIFFQSPLSYYPLSLIPNQPHEPSMPYHTTTYKSFFHPIPFEIWIFFLFYSPRWKPPSVKVYSPSEKRERIKKYETLQHVQENLLLLLNFVLFHNVVSLNPFRFMDRRQNRSWEKKVRLISKCVSSFGAKPGLWRVITRIERGETHIFKNNCFKSIYKRSLAWLLFLFLF